jgi:hypothetical protein
MFDRYAERFASKAGSGIAEHLKIRTDIKRNVSGEVARRLTDRGLSPWFGRSQYEVKVPVGDSYTRADILLQDAKVPIVIRPGTRIPAGGTLHVESKAGLKDYYVQQAREHLPFQAHARSVADGSMTVTTKDVADLEVEVQRAVRGAMQDTSPIYKFLPRKERLDGAVVRMIVALARERGAGV